jgi:hypothetical protein
MPNVPEPGTNLGSPDHPDPYASASTRLPPLGPGTRAALFFGALAILVLLVAWIDPRPNLRHVRVDVLSGSPTGNYYATVGRLAQVVSSHKGRIRNVTTAGSVENIQRLIEAKQSCDVHFALVQDGLAYPDRHDLELVGRLPRPESLVILGPNADGIRSPADLQGLRLSIGPVGSGTEQLMRSVLAPLTGLDLKVSTQTFATQLEMLVRGELDLAAMVIDDEAALVTEAVTKRKLQILGLPDAASLARRFPFARVGKIKERQVDYLRKLPPEDKDVLQIDTLVLGNGCASNGVTQGFMTALAELFPTFVSENKGQANVTGLPMATVAKAFFDNDGPDLLGKYAPWAVDILPLPTWIQLFLGFSVLFSGMRIWHRFRLWRLDANRIRIERDLRALFGAGATARGIAKMPPQDRHRAPEASAAIELIAARLGRLAHRCRRQSLSVLVPMGDEVFYRYQETLTFDLLDALQRYKERLRP